MKTGAKNIFGKILVCLDGSKIAEQILPYAAEQARQFKSRVILFRAYIVPSSAVAADIRSGAPIGPGLMRKEDKKYKQIALDCLLNHDK